MNDEQKKESQAPDKIDEQKDNREKRYEKSTSVGGVICAVAGYLCIKIGIIPLSGWREALFIGGAGAAGALIGMGFYWLFISTEKNKNIEIEKDEDKQK